MDLSAKQNVYFSAHLFEVKKADKANVLPSRTIQADLDDAILPQINAPSVLVETSPNRHQGFWIIREPLEPTELETLSRQLTYSIPNSDHSGWSLGHKMRVPGTFNHKYSGGPRPVKVISAVLGSYANLKIGPNAKKLLEQLNASEAGEDWTPTKLDIGPRELWLDIKGNLHRKIQSQYDIRQPDRSAALFALECALFRAGLDRDQVFSLAKESANNKFKDNRYHADIDLAKDVLSAQRAVAHGTDDTDDIRSKVIDARKLAGHASEKRAYVTALVRDNMAQHGSFVSTTDGQAWYVREDTGRPILLASRSEYLSSLLEIKFGLNSTEPEQRYVVQSLMSSAKERGRTGLTAALSHYDRAQGMVLLHTGRKDVLHIDTRGISSIANGNLNIVFPWRNNEEPFDPDIDNAISIDTLFQGCFDNLNEMAPQEGLALIKAWLYFLFFRNDATGRPILALLGQPGCVAGSTPLLIRRGEHSARYFTIATAFKNTQKSWNKTIPSRIMSVSDGIAQWMPIKNILYSGKKQTYEVVIEDHDSVTTTIDHRFLTREGYKQLKDLSIGDKVVVKGKHLTGNFGRFIHHNRRIVAADYHPFARQKIVNGYGPYGNILYCRAVLEANLNNIPVKEFLSIVHLQPDKVLSLKFLPKEIHIHHKDENPENDSLENLEPLTKLEHDTHHGHNNVANLGAWSGLYKTKTAKIISITPSAIEDTYDIEMEDKEAPNFLVNDIVLHNSGKSTTFRRIYTLLYGANKAVNSITTAEDFDQAVANDPMVVFDNVDTYSNWLPDKLALSASTSDLVKRKLYTDSDTVTLKRQALVGLTAHNPKFRREDIVDRLLILSLHRLPHFLPESDLLLNIIHNRDRLWGGIVKDIQRILAIDQPREEELPKFRISDFSRIGLWVARALGFEDDFRSALNRNIHEQLSFNLEEEDILVETIKFWVTTPNCDKNKYYTVGELWTQWSTHSRDPQNFVKGYRNAVSLGKKLWSLQETLKSVVNVDFDFDASGSKIWRFSKL